MPADERKAAKEAAKKAADEAEVLAKIAQAPEPWRTAGERLHRIIMEAAPGLAPRVRYGMPWYMWEGKSWCFFRVVPEFGFITLGFDDPAILARAEGAPQVVASAYRITEIDEAVAVELAAIVGKAAGPT